MKSQARLLPRLDQLYIQKKSYEIHRKKIHSIHRSSSLSKKSLSRVKLLENPDETKSQNSSYLEEFRNNQPSIYQAAKEIMPEKPMETIKQAKPDLSYWLKKMNPHQKRLRQQQIKQNKRIRQKIKNTMSFITRQQKLANHEQHYAGMKKMLNRYSVDQSTSKTKLRYEVVLTKINEIQKSKLKIQESRLMEYQKRDSFEKHKFLNKRRRSLSEKSKIQSCVRDVSLKGDGHLKKQPGTFGSSRYNVLSQQNSFVGIQSLSNKKDNLIKRVTKSLVRNSQQENKNKSKQRYAPQQSRNIIGFNKNFHRQNQVKTELIQRNSYQRLFNNSKLSNISGQSKRPKINFNDYKLMKMNHAKNAIKVMNRMQTTTFDDKAKDHDQPVRHQTEMKRQGTRKIKTEGLYMANKHSFSKYKNTETNLEFKKKRIQRFMKSNNILISKELSKNWTGSKQSKSVTTFPVTNKQQASSKKIAQKNQQTIQREKIDGENGGVPQNKLILRKQIQKKLEQIAQKDSQNNLICFTTQIQSFSCKK